MSVLNDAYRKKNEHFCKFCRWWDSTNQKGRKADCNAPLPEWVDNDRSRDRKGNDGLNCEAFERKAEKMRFPDGAEIPFWP